MEKTMNRRQLIGQYVSGKLCRLEKMAKQPNDAPVAAELAIMRRGIGKTPGEEPNLWGMLLCGMPEGLQSHKDGPTNAEWAVYTAMTLYALHQQGKKIKEENMSQPGQRLGIAVAQLAAKNRDSMEPVRRRFNAMATSADMPELSWHLRGMVQLLKSQDIKLDYPNLAEELYRYQFAESMPAVRLAWGRDFYREYNRLVHKDEEGKENDNDHA